MNELQETPGGKGINKVCDEFRKENEKGQHNYADKTPNCVLSDEEIELLMNATADLPIERNDDLQAFNKPTAAREDFDNYHAAKTISNHNPDLTPDNVKQKAVKLKKLIIESIKKLIPQLKA
jgi:hypothetical protein